MKKLQFSLFLLFWTSLSAFAGNDQGLNSSESEAIKALQMTGGQSLYMWYQFSSDQGVDLLARRVQELSRKKIISIDDLKIFWNFANHMQYENISDDAPTGMDSSFFHKFEARQKHPSRQLFFSQEKTR